MLKTKNMMPRIIVIGGGALTTHRLVAEDVVNKLDNKFGIDIVCSSHTTPLLN